MPNLKGDLKSGEEESVNVFDETYFDGYKAHAPMEPHVAVANIEGKKITIWASTQTPFRAKEAVAEALSIPRKKCPYNTTIFRRRIWR